MAAIRRALLAVLCALAFGAVPSAAQAAFDDPIQVYRPIPEPLNPFPIPPPTGGLEGPCGLAVGGGGTIYLSDYYHHVVDVFSSGFGYFTQATKVDPLDGPCGLAITAGNELYVNNFHRNVLRFAPGLGSFTVLTGVGSAEPEPTHPTGVAVDPVGGEIYVNQRTHVSVFDDTGAEVGRFGSFGNGFGIAYSNGLVYVPDAATDTVLVFDPAALDPDMPVATLSGAGTPAGQFTSLHNSTIAVDDTSGEIYVLDDLTPSYTDHHEGVVYVFSAAGAYEGRLKFSVDNAMPAGLAVDNSGAASKGRVYVTSGNSMLAAVYAYAPHSATANAVPLPAPPNYDPGSPAAPVAPLSAPQPAALAVSSLTSEQPIAASPSVAADPVARASAHKPKHRKHVKKKHRVKRHQARGARR
jgi:DNA-binding beta-propeller fold protein YncE